jgi:hypothetical protein
VPLRFHHPSNNVYHENYSHCIQLVVLYWVNAIAVSLYQRLSPISMSHPSPSTKWFSKLIYSKKKLTNKIITIDIGTHGPAEGDMDGALSYVNRVRQRFKEDVSIYNK